MTQSGLRAEDLLDDPFFGRLKAHVIEATGLSYYATQNMELARHLSERLIDLKLSTCGAYWLLLHDGLAGETELDRLIAQLTIGETFFFRHEEQFHAIRDQALPEVIERNRTNRRLRIWSAGCATGAEPYSLAILLRQRWPDVLAEWDVSILGTDINRTFLAQAREGRFGDWALRATSADLANSCFSRSGSEWVIRPEFRRCVSFHYHNLVQQPWPQLQNDQASFDIILCRNVMIYFSQETNRRIIGQFHGSLAENGWLIVGHAESNTELFQDFDTVNSSDAVLYRKTASPPAAKCAIGALENQIEPIVLSQNESLISPACDDSLDTIDGCREQTTRRPLNPEAHFRYALMTERRGRLSEAEQSLRRAIYLDRGFVLAHYYLGLLLKRRGELTGARRCFRNTLRLLEPIDRQAVFPAAEGIDASVLTELTRRHFEEVKNL